MNTKKTITQETVKTMFNLKGISKRSISALRAEYEKRAKHMPSLTEEQFLDQTVTRRYNTYGVITADEVTTKCENKHEVEVEVESLASANKKQASKNSKKAIQSELKQKAVEFEKQTTKAVEDIKKINNSCKTPKKSKSNNASAVAEIITEISEIDRKIAELLAEKQSLLNKLTVK